MPSKWQREFTCDWCAMRSFALAATLNVRSWYGMRRAWSLCETCTNRLFYLRGHATYADNVSFDDWLRKLEPQ